MSMTKQTTKLQITYMHIQSAPLFVHCLEFTIPAMEIAKLKEGSVAQQTSFSFVVFGDQTARKPNKGIKYSLKGFSPIEH